MEEQQKIKLENPKVFISYAWEDELSALAIDQWLRNKGGRVLIDRRDFIPGNDIEAEIVKCIKDAGKVVCIYSKKSADRPYPELERRIATTLEREKSNYSIENRQLIYFCIDDAPLPLEAQPRLAIKAASMDFQSACEEIWRSILGKSAPPKELDLDKFRDNPPWNMGQNEREEAIKWLKELEERYDALQSKDIKKIADLFRDFHFLPTQKYLERASNVLKQKLTKISHEKNLIEGECEKMHKDGRSESFFSLYMNLIYLNVEQERVLTHCQKAFDFIEAGINNGDPHQLDTIRKQLDAMFGIE